MSAESPSPVDFANAMAFTKPWRRYQDRVLKRLPRYLKDRHFHLVAAPGSGKTVLGLEIVRQLSKPTLVLAPTIAIREQWINRLTSDYLADGGSPGWMSRDLKNPAALTISTYQSLSSEFRAEGGGDALVARLRDVGISVLVVDEAHHLRAVWWKCLATVKDAIEEPVIVSLTATPPIDVPQSEWNRYATFCGEVDEEVGVPELVAEGNLCPHQDYVLLSTPTGEDVDELKRFREGVARLILDLQLDIELADAFGFNSPVQWITDQDDRDSLRKNQALYLGLAIFLQKTAGYIPAKVREVYNLDGEELPDQLDTQWAEGLLQGLLFDFRERIETTPNIAPHVKPGLAALEKRLRDLGAIEKSRVVLTGTEENDKILRDSPAKLQSIAEIIEHELVAQGVLMRAVILTDHIRKSAFPTAGMADPPLVKLGVVPIFELLRRLRLKHLFPGTLTGSIIIIPAVAEHHFREITAEFGIDQENLYLKPLPHDADFLEVDIREADRQRAVSAVTELFQRGEINCLIGTAALLGEGWDAPAVNTLVLASVIGSFVMSNQMRGRAIRSNPDVPEKTANIWHVATVPPDFEKDNSGHYDHGNDYRKLRRRFDAFHGVGFSLNSDDTALVESGWLRLGLSRNLDPATVDELNAEMFRQADDRPNMKAIWDRAIEPAGSGRFLRPVRALSTPRKLAETRFIAKIAGEKKRGFRYSLAGWLERRRLFKISKAIFQSLQECGMIGKEYSVRKLSVRVTPKRCHVAAPELEADAQVLFVTALGEFFDLFSNPRYLIHQQNRWFAVPKNLGTRKEYAAIFSQKLKRNGFGKHQLHFVHSREGKDFLLEARKQSLLQHFDFQTETQVRWESE